MIILAWLSYGAVALLAAALLACGLRRWHFAVSVSRAVVVSGLLILLASVATSVVVPLAAGDPSMKAVALSQGISEVLNTGGLAAAASLLAAPIWAISRWRLSRGRSKPGKVVNQVLLGSPMDKHMVRTPLPPHIADRIKSILATMDTEGGHIDNESARYGGIALMGTIGAVWLLRPDGSLWDVDDDFGRPLRPLPEEFHVMALAWGVERHPWLAELLPARPPDAVTCTSCSGRGAFVLTNVLPTSSRILCTDCQGLGWRPPS